MKTTPNAPTLSYVVPFEWYIRYHLGGSSSLILTHQCRVNRNSYVLKDSNLITCKC